MVNDFSQHKPSKVWYESSKMVNEASDNEPIETEIGPDGEITLKTRKVVALLDVMWAYEQAALNANKRDVSLTALELGIDRNTVYRHMRKFRGKRRPL